jgi:hypothetical protein
MQINKDFLILTHIGLNSLNSNTMSLQEQEKDLKCFLHDVWAQYSLGKNNRRRRITLLERNFSFEQPKHFKFNDIRQPKASLGYLGSIRSICRDTSGFTQRALEMQYRVSINGAATNNLQATTVPTNAVRQPIPVEGYLVQNGQNMQDILNMVLESESNFFI